MSELLMRMSTGFWVSRTIYAVAKLGVVDVLHKLGGRGTAEAISSHLSDTNPSSLFRLMRTISTLGVFDMQLQGSPENLAYHQTYSFALNETSQLLRSDVPNSLLPMILLEAGDVHFKGWLGILEAAKSGKEAVKSSLGVDNLWDYHSQDPEYAKTFNNAMSCFSELEVHEVLTCYDFSSISSLVDIGGGHGKLLFSIMRKYPNIKKGHLYDLPDVVKNVVVPEDLSGRVEIHGGSFLAEETNIPAGADAYIMKHIIHDWNDEKATIILKATRKAATPQSKVLLVEHEVPLDSHPTFATMLDLHMMVMIGGKERTNAEYAHILGNAGFDLIAAEKAKNSSLQVIEAHVVSP
jgi:hypothetical protein